MKFCRFVSDGQTLSGWADDSKGVVYASTDKEQPSTLGQQYPLASVRLLCPITPTKIVSVGLNYPEHLKEFGGRKRPEEPVVFLKALSALIGPEEPIVIPDHVGQVDYEAELGIVIGKRCHKVSRAEAMAVIAGGVCVNDVTARELQYKDSQWARAKSFDTFAPVGPLVATGLDLGKLGIEARLNGKVVQKSSTANMIFPVDFIVSYVSRIMTLEPGDVILTGTPEGIGPMKPGDTIEIIIEGIGTLRNPVVAEI